MEASGIMRDWGSGNAVESGSLVEMARRSVEARGGNLAFAWKEGGEWRRLSYVGLWTKVKNFAAGLSHLGVSVGDRVALMSTNRMEWPVVDLASQSLGAATVPVYPTLEEDQVSYILENSGVRVAVVEDEGMLAKILEIRANLSKLESVVLVEGEAAEALSFDEVSKNGLESPLEGWDEGWKKLRREDLATVIYTSGTTGPPKGARLTHGNILANVGGIAEALPVGPEDVFLSFLPLSHVFERTCGQFYALSSGAATYYAECIESVPENLREVKPTVMSSVPRLYEKMHDRVRAMVAEGSPSRRRIFEAAVAAGKQRYEHETRGERVPLSIKAKMALYDRLVFGRLREAVGGRARFFVSGGAKLDEEVGKFFHAAGVKIMEGYGLTETSPVIACNRLKSVRFGTVGRPLSNVEVRVEEGGEVQAKGPSIFEGYLDDPASDEGAFTEDGFFRTGDVGEFEDGYLRITDRLKNLLVLSTGKNVAPQPVEAALAVAPHVSQAVVLGDGEKYVSALIVPDYDAVRKTLGLESEEDLSSDERVREIIQRDMDEATERFAEYERPKRFQLLEREFSQEEGELTPTLKVKNRVVRERYKDAIRGLYD